MEGPIATRPVLALVGLALALGAGVTAAAQERTLSIQFTETLVVDYHTDALSESATYGFFDLRNRINLRLLDDSTEAGLRLDSALFLSAPETSPRFEDDFRLEKAYLTHRTASEAVQFTVGDHYVSFGSGLALCIRKVDELGLDTTLRGVKADMMFRALSLHGVLGWTNPTNQDMASEKAVGDTDDFIGGAQLIWTAHRALSVDLHAVRVWFDPLDHQPENLSLADRATVAGVGLSLPSLGDRLSLSVEVNWLGARYRRLPNASEGLAWDALSAPEDHFASFFSSQLTLGNWFLGLEMKSYHGYELYSQTPEGDGKETLRIDYIRAPTLEPADTENVANRDTTGARITLDVRPFAGETLLFASLAAILVGPERFEGRGHAVYHVQIGWERSFRRNGRVRLLGGTRLETEDPLTRDSQRLIYVKGTLSLPIVSAHSVELASEHRFVHWSTPAGVSDYQKGETSLAYHLSPWLSAGVIYSYDFSGKSYEPLLQDSTVEPWKRFLAGSLTLLLFGDRLALRSLFGRVRGGPKCIEGGCRIVPPFSGARLEITVRY